MKKMIIILTFLLLFCYAEAQVPGSGYSCPSELLFKWFHETGKAHKFKLKLVLYNNSQNLNAITLRISKSEPIKWVLVDKERDAYFTVNGYGKNILAQLEGKTDDEREAEIEEYCDIYTHIINEKLCIVEVLKTSKCRFFPAGANIEIGEFAVDLSDCEDGLYYIWAENTQSDYCFSYTGGVEGICGWPGDSYLEIQLYKSGDLVSIWPWFPLDDYDGVDDVEKSKTITSVKYYNLAGVDSAEPQDGVSIKVTTYSDGTRSSEKIVR